MVAVQDVAIKRAASSNTLSIKQCYSTRFEEYYWSISDDIGVIETFDSHAYMVESLKELGVNWKDFLKEG